jgi:hypothetical protein
MTYDIGNPGPDMGQAQKCYRVKPILKKGPIEESMEKIKIKYFNKSILQ